MHLSSCGIYMYIAAATTDVCVHFFREVLAILYLPTFRMSFIPSSLQYVHACPNQSAWHHVAPCYSLTIDSAQIYLYNRCVGIQRHRHGYIFHVQKPSKCTGFTYYNIPRSLRLLVATARSSRYTRVATAYDPHAILE